MIPVHPGRLAEQWDAAAALAWSLWAELGVSAWKRAHRDWSIELEPLIVLTAWIAEREPRLLREAVDWCALNQRHVSLSQLRRVVTAERLPFAGPLAAFGATVTERTGRAWPAAGQAPAYALTASGKSSEPDLGRPSLLGLRLRAIFGIGARAEIVRVMLLARHELSVRQLAGRVAYTRRQIELDLELLTRSGLVRRHGLDGPATYQLERPDAVQEVVGPLPGLAPNWAPAMRTIIGTLEAFEELVERPLAAPETALHRALRAVEDPLARSGLVPPEHNDPEGVLEWMSAALSALGRGEPHVLRPDSVLVRGT